MQTPLAFRVRTESSRYPDIDVGSSWLETVATESSAVVERVDAVTVGEALDGETVVSGPAVEEVAGAALAVAAGVLVGTEEEDSDVLV